MASAHQGSKAFFTIKEAASHVGVNRKTFYRWTKRPKKNRPPIVRISDNCIRVPIEEFKSWLNSKMEK